jgi:hypothetical protein
MQVVVTQMPAPPAPEAVVAVGGPPLWLIVMILLLGAALLWPLIRAIARRIEGGGRPDESLQRQVDELEQRVVELSQRDVHVAELEERLDFAERLLAQRMDSAALPPRVEGR